jgi:hypothetical protein
MAVQEVPIATGDYADWEDVFYPVFEEKWDDLVEESQELDWDATWDLVWDPVWEAMYDYSLDDEYDWTEEEEDACLSEQLPWSYEWLLVDQTADMPEGYEGVTPARMRADEVLRNEVSSDMDQWDIIELGCGGKFDGSGYGNTVHDAHDGECCAQMLVARMHQEDLEDDTEFDWSENFEDYHWTHFVNDDGTEGYINEDGAIISYDEYHTYMDENYDLDISEEEDVFEFYEEAPDTICVESDMIITEEECEQAMIALGDWGYVSTYNSPNVIPGCYYNSNSRQIGFNPNVDGVNTYGNVSGSICRY